MSLATTAVVTTLVQVRTVLLSALGELRPETEYLRGELVRLLEQVDTLEGKVENEQRLARDKEALQ